MFTRTLKFKKKQKQTHQDPQYDCNFKQIFVDT